MSGSWRRISVVIFVVLLITTVFLFAFSYVNGTQYTGQTFAKDFELPIGQSMFEGDSITGNGQQIELPVVSNFYCLYHQLYAFDLKGLFMSFATGFVPFDFTDISSTGIDSYGNVKNVDGPGYLTFEGDKLAVRAPDTYVWGYSSPYKVATKTESGIDIVKDGKVIKSVPVDKIKDLDVGNKYFNATSLANWYNYDSEIGDNYTLEKGIVGFSDGRNNISYGNVSYIFGEEVKNYVDAYPVYTPILLYMGNTTKVDGETYSTTLGSHPEYGDTIREYNARQFVEAWNGTVIPPNSTSTGHDYVDFGSATDENAPGGSASHGVCPPARTLRAAVLAEGFSMPVGMTSDQDAVLFGYNPASDIKVTNTHEFPIKINMWTEGSGTGMGIYCKIERFIPK